MSISENFCGAGGRKRSTARVFLIPVKEGTGKFTVNKKSVTDYFPEIAAASKVYQPLNLLKLEDLLNQYNIKATVKGGGKSGQRDALCLGLSKALVMLEANNKKSQTLLNASDDELEVDEDKSLSWRKSLRQANMLTRDSRRVEPKRYGLHKARKRAPLVKR